MIAVVVVAEVAAVMIVMVVVVAAVAVVSSVARIPEPFVEWHVACFEFFVLGSSLASMWRCRIAWSVLLRLRKV